jgi:hypothetical protein
MAFSKHVLCGSYGWYAEVYTDDDGASGYGDNPKVGHWYGSREDCERLDPRKVDLYTVRPSSGVDDFDLACERRYDNEGM